MPEVVREEASARTGGRPCERRHVPEGPPRGHESPEETIWVLARRGERSLGHRPEGGKGSLAEIRLYVYPRRGRGNPVPHHHWRQGLSKGRHKVLPRVRCRAEEERGRGQR